MSIEALTEEIRKRAAQSPKLGYRLKFVLAEGGVILWDGTGVPPAIGNDDGDADTTIRVTSDNLQKLMTGGLDPTLAYMTGKLKVEGSLGVAMKLVSMLGD
jgi:putative sterol carrier protein